MPIYEYSCTKCNHHFDLMQKINDKPATQCPQCFEETVIRLISAAGFQLKGTGWYATDFKNSGKKEQPTNKETDSKSSSSENKTRGSGSSESSTSGSSKE